MSAHATLRRRIEAQGFLGLDDDTLARLGPWLRWSPVLCTLAMIAGVALRSPPILWTLAAIALLGALLPFHPFDLLYNLGMRHLTGTLPAPDRCRARDRSAASPACWPPCGWWPPASHSSAGPTRSALRWASA